MPATGLLPHVPTRAHQLGISTEAVELYYNSEVIDLHTDSFIWKRVFGYRLGHRHWVKPWLPVLGQVDFPRCIEAGMAGVVWDIPTNPLRFRSQKMGVLRQNISQILEELQTHSQHFQHVLSYSDYQAARAAGKIASWISIQGGQAVDNRLEDLERIPEVHRITLIHFSKSKIGASNFDATNHQVGLSHFGKDFVQKMVECKILVDLSHINRKGFFDALSVMPSEVPPIVTHTGVNGVRQLWRNIDDAQIKAIAERNGTIGIIYADQFLAASPHERSYERIVDHMAHVIKVAGEDYVSLGSDYDGLIILPNGLADITEQPRLVQEMLNRGWSEERIRKILGLNFLRVVKQIRP